MSSHGRYNYSINYQISQATTYTFGHVLCSLGLIDSVDVFDLDMSLIDKEYRLYPFLDI